mmetsp:Transcript_51090/g.102063  ORF Transcript_51090/g.102063 Transcript_51090/m.102063 type:complete len:275 (+) Transcript_51090:80-904(+)
MQLSGNLNHCSPSASELCLRVGQGLDVVKQPFGDIEAAGLKILVSSPNLQLSWQCHARPAVLHVIAHLLHAGLEAVGGHEQRRVDGNHCVRPALLPPLTPRAHVRLRPAPARNGPAAQDLGQELDDEGETSTLVSTKRQERSLKSQGWVCRRVSVLVNRDARRQWLARRLVADGAEEGGGSGRHVEDERTLLGPGDGEADRVGSEHRLLPANRRHHLGASRHHDRNQARLGDGGGVVGEHPGRGVGVVRACDRELGRPGLGHHFIHCRGQGHHP